MSEQLLVQREDPVCTVVLNRPEKRNALTPEMMFELAELLQGLKDDDRVRVVVIRGAGTEAFSAGFDIGRIGQRQTYINDSFLSPVAYACEVIEQYPYPVIAMVYGFCVGGALELATACDFRIAADTARLGITPSKLGIVYLPEPVRRFVELVGAAHTKELFITGRLVTAERALQMGLVNEVVPATQLEEYTYTLAVEIAHNAPLSVKAAKETVNRLIGFPRLTPQDVEHFRELRRLAMESEDLKEGRRAFAEKRRPVFRGR